jgi:hypothetical protein
LKRFDEGVVEITLLREIDGFLAKENSSGNESFRGCPTQQSSQKRQEAPSEA